MSKVDDLIQAEQAEKAVITELATAVVSLAQSYQDLSQKYNDLVFQGSNVTAITAEQLQGLSDDFATGKQLASDALDKAKAALNPPQTLVTEPGTTAPDPAPVSDPAVNP